MYVAILRLPWRALFLWVLILTAAGLPALGLRALPALAPQLSAVQPPICRVERPEREVALSFEAVWVDTQCNRILDLLEHRKVRATFFISGYWAERYPDLVRRIAGQGHELGNYTFSHPHLTSLSAEAIRAELEENARLLRELSDLTPHLFRPPFGEYNALVMAVAKELGYKVVWYDVKAPDRRRLTVDDLVAQVLKEVQPGSILSFRLADRQTIPALARLLPLLEEEGYRIVPVGQLLWAQDYYVDREGVQRLLPDAGK